MPRVRLTDAVVERLKIGTDRRQEFFDTLMPGLALRVSKHDRKSWVLFYRAGERQVRVTLGRYPVMQLCQARNQSRLILSGFPVVKQPAVIPDPEPLRPFAETFREFIERHAKVNNKSWAQTARLGERRLIPQWGTKPLGEIRKADIVTLLDDIVDAGTPVQANLTLAHVRKFFNWCTDRGYLDKSPCDGVGMPTRVISRDRVLSDIEINKVWTACDDLGAPFGDYIKVLLLTGQRRGEVAGMTRDEIDGDVWTIPKARTKNGTAHPVPLSPAALALIGKQSRDRELVFTTTGETPISGFSKLKVQIDKAVGFSNWRLYDLRRTCATGMARLGVQPHVVEKVLNHKSGAIRGVSATYNRYGYADECRNALQLWSDHIERIIQ